MFSAWHAWRTIVLDVGCREGKKSRVDEHRTWDGAGNVNVWKLGSVLGFSRGV
jgi:hypothetical protein